jgi:hypothetical protein
VTLRKEKDYLGWFYTSSLKYSWNSDAAKSRVVPMIQGRSEEAVWQICQQGFGVVGSTNTQHDTVKV